VLARLEIAPSPSEPPPGDPQSPPADPTVPQVLDNALSLLGLLDDIDNAFTTLFGYWQEDYPLQAAGSACEKAARAGLQCLYGRGDWDNLRFYNRPAVIELLLAGGRRYHLVVAGLNAEQVTLDLGSRRVQVPPGELAPLWSGSYIVLWRPPPLNSEVLREGSAGPDVHWLSRRLSLVDGLPLGQPDDPAEARFDTQLTQRVMAFQRAVGLREDGIVGQRTLLKLQAAAGAPPLLDRS
jgi:general secretion pathway protein A